MSGLIGFWFSITGPILCLVVIAAWWHWHPQSVAPRRALTALAIGYLCASIYAVPFFIARIALVGGYHRFTRADVRANQRTAVVVLGGGGLTVRGWDGDQAQAMAPEGVARVLEAARVFRLIEAQWIISSGGFLDATRTDITSAAAMRDMLTNLGVPPSRILLETQSRNTHDEAVYIAPMLRTLRADNLVLVTSDIHMRRSMGTFRAVGLAPIPAIAPDPHSREGVNDWIIPADHGLRLSGAVVHELAGIPYYTARRWWSF